MNPEDQNQYNPNNQPQPPQAGPYPDQGGAQYQQGYTAQQNQQPLPYESPRQATKRPALPDPEPSTISTSGIPDFSKTDALAAAIPPSKGWSSIKGFISAIELFAGALLLALLINSFIFQSYQVFGHSMETTLQEGDRLIISKVGKSWAETFHDEYIPARGHVVVFKNPRNSSIQLVKRVIGLPGERVVVKDGSIRVYNDEFPEGFNPDEGQVYRENLPDYTDGNIEITVPEGQIFVSGDNRTGGNSLDSRNDLGTVPLENVVGELWVRIFPLSGSRFF